MSNTTIKKRKGIRLVPMKSRYPALKQLVKLHKKTFKEIYLQMDPMRPEQFTNIIYGSIPEPADFPKVLIDALRNIGILTTIDELKEKNN